MNATSIVSKTDGASPANIGNHMMPTPEKAKVPPVNFAGFGAAVAPKRHDVSLMKAAEGLIQELLNDEKEQLTKESIQKAFLMHRTKPRNMGEKPSVHDGPPQQNDLNQDASTVVILQARVASLEGQLQSVGEELQSSRKQEDIRVNELQAKIVSLEEELVYSEARLDDHQEESNAALNDIAEETDIRNEELQYKVAHLEEQLVYTEAMLQDAQAESNLAPENDMLKKKVIGLEKKLAEREDPDHRDVSELQLHLDELESQLAEADRAMHSYKKESQSLLAGMEKQLLQESKQLSEERVKVADLEHRLQKENTPRSSNDRNDALRRSVAELQHQVAFLKRKTEKSERKMLESERRLNYRQEESAVNLAGDSISAESISTNVPSKSVEELELKCQELTEKLVSTRAKLRETKDKSKEDARGFQSLITELEEQIMDGMASSEETVQLKKTIERLEKQVETISAERSSSEHQRRLEAGRQNTNILKLKAKLAATTASRNDTPKTQHEIVDPKEQIAVPKDQRKSKSPRETTETQELQGRLVRLQGELAVSNNTIDGFRDRVDTLEKELKEVKTKAAIEKESSTERVTEMKSTVASLETKLKEAEKNLLDEQNVSAQVRFLTNQMKQSEEQSAAELDVFSKQLASLQERELVLAKQLREKEESAAATADIYDQHIAELEIQIPALQSQLKEKNDSIAAANNVTRNLIALRNSEIESLKRKLMDSQKAPATQAERATSVHQESLRRKEKELDIAKVDVAIAIANLESTEQKLTNLEETHEAMRVKMEAELGASEEKVNLLQEKLSKSETANRDLSPSEEDGAQLRAHEETLLQRINQTKEEAEERIRAMKVSVDAANEAARDANQRLSDLERAQALEQEILSEELRDSESTIANLMDELNGLRPLATDLEHAEQELESTQKHLEREQLSCKELKQRKAELDSEIEAMRHELALMRPLALDLEQANQKLFNVQVELQRAEEEISRLIVPQESGTVSSIRQQLEEEKARNDQLEKECAKAKSSLEGSGSGEVSRIKSLLARKEKEIESLQIEVDTQEKQILSSRIQIESMDEERNYARAKMSELTSLVDSQRSSENDESRRLHKKTEECATLIAERDTLRQKLSVIEAMATALELDNKQKKAMVQQLLVKSGGDSSSEAFIESLQTEQERTLKRCGDLSLQLAESQFKIDELTNELRSHRKKAVASKTKPKSMQRSASYRNPSRTISSRSANFAAALGKKLDRLGSTLEDKLNALDGSQDGDDGSEFMWSRSRRV